MWQSIKGFFAALGIIQWFLKKYDEWKAGVERREKQKAEEDVQIAKAHAARDRVNSPGDLSDDDFEE